LRVAAARVAVFFRATVVFFRGAAAFLPRPEALVGAPFRRGPFRDATFRVTVLFLLVRFFVVDFAAARFGVAFRVAFFANRNLLRRSLHAGCRHLIRR
jgi:hypothetical protein